jgi:hypothetical protein
LTLGIVEGVLQICDCTAEIAEVKIDREALGKIDNILDQRAQNIEISPAFSAGTLREITVTDGSELFLSQIGNSLVMLTEEDDGLITIKTDENGFRNPQGLYDGSDILDVFLIGDSFTEGWSVPDGFTIVDVTSASPPPIPFTMAGWAALVCYTT